MAPDLLSELDNEKLAVSDNEGPSWDRDALTDDSDDRENDIVRLGLVTVVVPDQDEVPSMLCELVSDLASEWEIADKDLDSVTDGLDGVNVLDSESLGAVTDLVLLGVGVLPEADKSLL